MVEISSLALATGLRDVFDACVEVFVKNYEEYGKNVGNLDMMEKEFGIAIMKKKFRS